MSDKELGQLVDKLNKVNKNLNIHKIEKTDAGFSLYMDEPKYLAGLSKEYSSIVYRSPLERPDLDLSKKSVSLSTPQELYRRSYNYYYEQGLYGTVIDTLTNLSAKGFENDVDDPVIKYFYDSWNIQCDFKKVIRWILFDFFRIGLVRTYKVLGKYDPPISYLKPPPEFHEEVVETAQRKYIWSKEFIPIRYTVLNPMEIEIEGSLLFDMYKVSLKPNEDLRKLFTRPANELTDEEKKIKKALPPEWAKALNEGKPIPLDPKYIGSVDYRKQPYEKYPKPRGSRAFDALEYKEKLQEADMSTLDGITNHILKITLGTDEFPCTSQEEIERVSSLFNTPSKAFHIVYNHTLNIEKIVSPEIENILGQEKYSQVNEDLTGAFGIVRAIIDGTGNMSTGGAQLAVKGLIEEVNYAREELTDWIYEEYRAVAEAAGFDHHPRVRWDDMVLRDEIMMTSLIQGMIDRRIISYQTGHEKLGLNHDTELNQLQREKPLVLKGDIGLWGSPYNPKAQPFVEDEPEDEPELSPEDVQLTPDGTPSEGRPRGGPGTRKTRQAEVSSLGDFKLSDVSLKINIEELGGEDG
jgi:hypothetical protein